MTEQPLTPQPADIASQLGHTTPNVTAGYTVGNSLPPEVVSAILRDEGSPLYPSKIAVYCDECGTEVARDYMVSTGQPRSERLEVARAHLRGNGWRCDEHGDFCPACAGPATVAPDPAVTIAFILDRLDRGKTLTGTEVRTLRSCFTSMQAPAHLRRAAERLRREHAAVYDDAGRHTADGVLRAADLLDEWATATGGE
jgi:hypothetical protein